MKRTLVADGNSDTLFCFRSFFSDEECERIDFVKSPSLAVRMLKQKQYDSVVSDIYFPNDPTSGLEIFKQADQENVPERVILTAISNALEPQEFNATKLVRKPITKRKLRSLCLSHF